MSDEQRLTITCGDRTLFDQIVTEYECTTYAPTPEGQYPPHTISLTATMKREDPNGAHQA